MAEVVEITTNPIMMALSHFQLIAPKKPPMATAVIPNPATAKIISRKPINISAPLAGKVPNKPLAAAGAEPEEPPAVVECFAEDGNVREDPLAVVCDGDGV